jgi:hypothetical protein
MRDDDLTFETTVGLARCLNALGHLASPRAWVGAAARTGEADLRAGVTGAVAEAAALLGTPAPERAGEPFAAAALALERVAAAARCWTAGPPPAALQRAAGHALAALGVPAPAGGWATFEPDAP